MSCAIASDYTPYQARVFGWIDTHIRPQRHAKKMLARWARVTPRTAENWLAGENAPRGDQLILLMAHNDALADEINKLVAETRAKIK